MYETYSESVLAEGTLSHAGATKVLEDHCSSLQEYREDNNITSHDTVYHADELMAWLGY